MQKNNKSIFFFCAVIILALITSIFLGYLNKNAPQENYEQNITENSETDIYSSSEISLNSMEQELPSSSEILEEISSESFLETSEIIDPESVIEEPEPILVEEPEPYEPEPDPELEPESEVEIWTESEVEPEPEPSYEPSSEIEYTPVSEYYWDGPILTATKGVNYGPSGKETYYNLPMDGIVEIMRIYCDNYDEHWIREDGCHMLGDYIMVAADLSIRPRGSLIPTSLGMGIVCDTGGFIYIDSTQIDIAVIW